MWQWSDKLYDNTNNDIMALHYIGTYRQPATTYKRQKHFYILDSVKRTGVSSFGDAMVSMRIEGDDVEEESR